VGMEERGRAIELAGGRAGGRAGEEERRAARRRSKRRSEGAGLRQHSGLGEKGRRENSCSHTHWGKRGKAVRKR